jgi:hypothetical protein
MKLAWLAAAAVGMMGAAPGSASAIVSYQLQQSYAYTSPYDLHHGLSYNTYANGAGTTNSYNLDAPGGVLTDPFLKDPFNPPLLTYFLGTSNLFDQVQTENGQDGHLLIAFNDTFASSLLSGGEDFSVTFDGFNESGLIAALTLLDTADLAMDDAGYAAQMQAKEDAGALIGGFTGKVQTLGGLTAANGGTFTLVSFSTPGLAGTGTALLTPVPGAVPEPASWAMMIAGFGMVGAAMRTRRRTSVSFG